MIKLHTDRLLIRDYIIEDLETYHEFFSDNVIMKYLQDIKKNTIDESKEELLGIIEDSKNEDRKFNVFRIEDKDTNELIGGIGYTVIEKTKYGKK
jgi:ribosomal-protein-alanine N-acetyltransferase